MTLTGGMRVDSQTITTLFHGARLLSHERAGSGRGVPRVDSSFNTRDFNLVLCIGNENVEKFENVVNPVVFLRCSFSSLFKGAGCS